MNGMNKVIVGLSGGVDSAVAAYLLKKDGYDVVGVTLRTWQAFFNNEGGASLHDACHPGFTYWACLPRGEIMQMDGAMGAVVAIQELFAYEEDEALHFGAGFPLRWQAASCRGMVLSCGLLASGTLRDGRWHLRLRATRPIRRTVIVRNGPPRAISLQAGEEMELDE